MICNFLGDMGINYGGTPLVVYFLINLDWFMINIADIYH
jgi:hypothetical protein